jgi:hypothetical protein
MVGCSVVGLFGRSGNIKIKRLEREDMEIMEDMENCNGNSI